MQPNVANPPDIPDAPLFHCRFCGLQAVSYVDLLCHELEIHFWQYSCESCEELATKLSSHLRLRHACFDTGQNLAPSCVQFKSVKDELNTQEFVRVKEEPVESDTECNVKYQFVGSSNPLPDVHGLDEEANDRPPSPAAADVTVQSRFPSWPIGEPRSVHKKCQRLISDHKINVIVQSVDAVDDELRKLELDKSNDLKQDTDESLFTELFCDVVDTEQEGSEQRAEDTLANLDKKFISQVHGLIVHCSSEEDRQEEKELVSRRDSFLCPRCALPFNCESQLSLHLSRFHGEPLVKAFKCGTCRLFFYNRCRLVQHCASKPKRTFKCPIKACSRVFDFLRERNMHAVEVHGGFPCRHCGEKFSTYTRREVHVGRCHTSNKRPVNESQEATSCRICQASDFPSVPDLKEHERKCRLKVNRLVGPKRKRKYVPKVFTPETRARQRESNKRYMERQKELRFKCRVCCVNCYGEQIRNKHEEECHLTDSDGVTTLKCPECTAVFPYVSELNQHMKTHPGYADIQCPHCPKKFLHKSGLHHHLDVVHKKKRHVCETCGAEFRSKYAFDEHMSKHEGKARHVCADCGKRMFCYPTWYDHRRRYCPVLEGKEEEKTE